MTEGEISIIVPVYKSEATLERCIESLKAQTYEQIEIIMIVDSPPDPSGILADKLALTDPRIRVIHQPNQGVSNARNAGLKAARGEYIQFLDSDDYADENACRTLLDAMRENRADLVVCGFHHLYFGRDVVKTPRIGSFLAKGEPERVFELYRTMFLNMPWNKLFRRSLITGGFRRELDLGEDLLFNMEYLKNCGRVTVIGDALCYYIQDERGTTLSTKKREDRMESAVALYRQLYRLAGELYGSLEGCAGAGALETRLLEGFLDDLEGLAFERKMSRGEKLSCFHKYYEGWRAVERRELAKPSLPDYKILYFFFRRKRLRTALALAEARGLLVRLLRRRGGGGV